MDVRITAGRIAEIAPELRAARGEDEFDAQGGWLLPGLHDHHVHLRALAAAADSVRCGPPQVRTCGQLRAALREADRDLPAERWIRGVGYHESVGGELDRHALDRMLSHRPVRVQHRSGALWMLNSRAAELVGLDDCAIDDRALRGVERDAAGRSTGRLWRLDSWLAGRIGRDAANGLDLAAVSSIAARRGVTGFTDATPGMSDDDIGTLADSALKGEIRQRVHCMAPHDAIDPRVPRFTLGPTKILLDDDALPALGEFVALIRSAHAAARSVAVHCVTRAQLMLTQVALDEAGVRAGDRVEHGAIIPAQSLAWLRERGVVVVTQPHFVAERGEQYERDVPADELPDLWRLRSLRAAGVRTAAGTDAPFGSADPWAVVRAAAAPRPWPGSAENVPAREAVRLFLGRPDAPDILRTLAPGQPADLMLLRLPPAEAVHELGTGCEAGVVTATFVAGDPIYVVG